MGLSRTSEYETIELTGRDSGRLMKTLWLRADDIPVQQPIYRVIFHALFLLFAHGGFRQGMGIGKVKFRDIQMAIIRDPVDATRRRLVTTIEIYRHKLKQDALEYKKGERLITPLPLFHLGRQTDIVNRYSFSTTLLPYLLLCLTAHRCAWDPLQSL